MNSRLTRKPVAVFLALALTPACNPQHPSPDWNGAWKLNPAKGNFQGPVFSISIAADGEYRFKYNGRADITFRCDGKDQPIGKNRTRTCVKSSPTVLDSTLKENGVKTTVTHWELSPDGKTLAWTTTTFRPSGPEITDQFVASRISGSNDFVGQWRNMNFLQQHADLTLRVDSQTLHMGYPSGGQHIDAPFDGSDTAWHGPRAPEGLTYSARLAGRREIFILSKRDGETLDQKTTLELSSDGRVITESWWSPSQPAGKGMLVYEKK